MPWFPRSRFHHARQKTLAETKIEGLTLAVQSPRRSELQALKIPEGFPPQRLSNGA